MQVRAIRFAPVAAVVLVTLAALTAVFILASRAGAADVYSPKLSKVSAGSKLDLGPTAPYTASTQAKATAKYAKPVKTEQRAPVRVASSASGELAKAQSILSGHIKARPILKGTTVSFGDARGYQAIAFYQSGRIIISRTHTASLERIIGHEIWHVIDWRDNGRINWGEQVPPR